jgi:hypothetical protein
VPVHRGDRGLDESSTVCALRQPLQLNSCQHR